MSSHKPEIQPPAGAPMKARIGLALILDLVKRGASRNEIIGTICATIQESPHYAADYFLNGLVTIGHLSEQEAQACRQLYAKRFPERPALRGNATGEFPLQVTIALEFVEALRQTDRNSTQIAGAILGAAKLMPAQQVGTFLDEMLKREVIDSHTANMCREIYLEENPGCQSLALN